MKYFSRFVASLVFVAFLSWLPVALAGDFIKDHAPPLKEIPLMPEAEFNSKTTLYEDTPGGDSHLAYSVRIPQSWEKPENSEIGAIGVADDFLGEILRFYSPPMLDSRSSFAIEAGNLSYKLTATEWLMQHLVTNGYTIQGIVEINEKRAEAIYVKVEKDVAYVIRAAAVMNGKRIILAQYALPSDYWEQDQQMQAQVIKSFALTSPVEETVEEMTKYRFLDISEFFYPASWQFKSAPLKNADRMSFYLLRVASEERVNWKDYKRLNGRIQADIVAHDIVSSLGEEVQVIKENLSGLGLVLGDVIEKRDVPKLKPAVNSSKIEVYRAIDNETNSLDYEFFITVLESGDYYYFISMISPSRDQDFFVWARNKHTFNMVLETFQPLDESLVGR
ncbi:MAG: hypothetical protein WBK77_00315 [Alphaproteobacteria bacterium]